MTKNYDYRFEQFCLEVDAAGNCDPPRTCQLPGGEVGFLWWVLRKRIAPPEPDFARFAGVCLALGEEDQFELITWQRVWAVMKTLEWPQAELGIEPVGGRTLINFETNFFTNTVGEKIQPVRLGAKRVEIKAIVDSYTWHWGDGSKSLTTTKAGAAHEDGVAHDLFHVYMDAGVKVRPSVDVTYRGEYRIDGGPWQSMVPTLTVEGDPVALEVVSARVQLVG